MNEETNNNQNTDAKTPNQSQSEPNMKAVFAYVLGWISGLIVLLTEKEDKNVRFHAAQSIIFFGAITIIFMIPGLGQLLALLLWPVSFAAWIILTVKAYKGDMVRIPVVCEMADALVAKV